MKHECADCNAVYESLDPPVPLEEVDDLRSRLSPGSEVPSGECSCGALTYLVKEEEPEPVKGLQHREPLLLGLLEVLRERDRRRQRSDATLGKVHLSMDLDHIDVRLTDEDGDVLLETCWLTAFDYVINDLYWNENGDWSEASKVVSVS